MPGCPWEPSPSFREGCHGQLVHEIPCQKEVRTMKQRILAIYNRAQTLRRRVAAALFTWSK